MLALGKHNALFGNLVFHWWFLGWIQLNHACFSDPNVCFTWHPVVLGLYNTKKTYKYSLHVVQDFAYTHIFTLVQKWVLANFHNSFNQTLRFKEGVGKSFKIPALQYLKFYTIYTRKQNPTTQVLSNTWGVGILGTVPQARGSQMTWTKRKSCRQFN